MSQAPTVIDTVPHEFDVFTRAEYQEQQATQLTEIVFGSEENAEKTGNIITRFVTSYEQHKHDMPLDQWLMREFRQYPTIWVDEEELASTAREIILTVENNNTAKASLHEHLEKGKSRESWLAKRIEEGAKAAGVTNVGAYAGQIETAMSNANEGMAKTIFTKSGTINMGRNLDGFIAEQHHADTFNIDAVAKGSEYRAKVLVPEGKAYAKNSMDIGIYDKNGKLVRRYQAKYGKDADSTGKQFEKGDYRGQRKLGPKGHGYEERIEIDGVSSKPLTKEQAKALQEKAQQEAEIKQYDWNDVNRIAIAKNIGKQALVSAAFTAGIHGARILGRRAWNSITGKKNSPASEDLREFFESSVKSGANTGVQVAVSGAVVVAAKSGWLGAVLKASPVGRVVNMAYAGMENAKILYKYGKGEISEQEALDLMGNTTAGVVGSVMGAAEGAALGATLGIIGSPIGIVVGGFVGGVVGGMAGSKIGQVAYEGGKKIVTTAVSAAKSIVSTTVSAVKSVASALNPCNWFK
jgi:Phosphate/sulphate permeases